MFWNKNKSQEENIGKRPDNCWAPVMIIDSNTGVQYNSFERWKEEHACDEGQHWKVKAVTTIYCSVAEDESETSKVEEAGDDEDMRDEARALGLEAITDNETGEEYFFLADLLAALKEADEEE